MFRASATVTPLNPAAGLNTVRLRTKKRWQLEYCKVTGSRVTVNHGIFVSANL